MSIVRVFEIIRELNEGSDLAGCLVYFMVAFSDRGYTEKEKGPQRALTFQSKDRKKIYT